MTLDKTTKTSAKTNDPAIDNKKTPLPTEKISPNKPSASGNTENKDTTPKNQMK